MIFIRLIETQIASSFFLSVLCSVWIDRLICINNDILNSLIIPPLVSVCGGKIVLFDEPYLGLDRSSLIKRPGTSRLVLGINFI